MNGIIGFDLEIARPFPEDGWNRESSLGISCAATYSLDPNDIRVYHPSFNGETYADEMSPERVQAMIDELVRMSGEKYIVTWNGLGFDFLVLAIESRDFKYKQKVANLALAHIDPFFNMFCDKGYGIGLQKMSEALNIRGKLEGMHGSLAPYMWTGNPTGITEDDINGVANIFGVEAGSMESQELCIDYVKQDARATYDIYQGLFDVGSVYWKTRKGTMSRYPWTPKRVNDRLYTCAESLKTREPNTSWMDEPRSRSEYMGWTLQYGD